MKEIYLKIDQIKAMFDYSDHIIIRIENCMEHDANGIGQSFYCCSVMHRDFFGRENPMTFVENENTKKIGNICGNQISETGNSIESALNKLYKLCALYFRHKYSIQVMD